MGIIYFFKYFGNIFALPKKIGGWGRPVEERVCQKSPISSPARAPWMSKTS